MGVFEDDIKDAKMPKEWDNIMNYNDEGIKLLAYNKMTVVLWGTFQHLISEVTTHLKGEITKSKGKGKGKDEDLRYFI